MARAMNVDITLRHEGVVPEYIEFRSADRTMQERFGVRPEVSFEDGFRRFHDYFRQGAHVAG